MVNIQPNSIANDVLELLKYASKRDLYNNILIVVLKNIDKADAGAIYTYDNNRKRLILKAAYGFGKAQHESEVRANKGIETSWFDSNAPSVFTVSNETIQSNKILKAISAKYSKSINRKRRTCKSALCVPLIYYGKMIALLTIEQYNDEDSFAQPDIQKLIEISGLISVIVNDMEKEIEYNQIKRSYKELLGSLISKTEEERQAIAREIHDEANQMLLSVRFDLENLKKLIPDSINNFQEINSKIDNSRNHLDMLFKRLRQLSVKLRPPELDLGLSQALDWYISSLKEELHLNIKLELEGISLRRPAPLIETELFRITQEALSNVHKHANCDRAKVKLQYNSNKILLNIQDNGIGFDVSKTMEQTERENILGLLGMRERVTLCGGELRIKSTPGKGTRIRVEIPITSYDWGTY